MKLKRFISILIAMMFVLSAIGPSLAFADSIINVRTENNIKNNDGALKDTIQQPTINNSPNNVSNNKDEATETFTITYHSGDGFFSDGTTEKQVVYAKDSTNVFECFHTHNIDETGYAMGQATTEEKLEKYITIDEAASLEIEVWYACGRGGMLCIGPVDAVFTYQNNYRAATVTKGLITGGTGTTKESATHRIFQANMNAIHFLYYADDGQYGGHYGCYAIIRAKDAEGNYINKSLSIAQSNYEEPTKTYIANGIELPCAFNGWTLFGETDCVDINNLNSDIDLYAQYSENRITVASGTTGGVSWVLYENGDFVLYSTNGISGTMDSFNSGSAIPWNDVKSQIINVKVMPGVSTGDKAPYLFSGCNNVKTIDLHNLDTSNNTLMSNMFCNCYELTSLKLNGINTENVTSMEGLFINCIRLKTIELNGFDTSSVTNFNSMFSGCASLKTIDVNGFDTSNATTMNRMFYDCVLLTTLDLSNFNTGSLTSMQAIFGNCKSLVNLNVNNWDVSKVTSMGHANWANYGVYGAFQNCSSLKNLDLSGWNTIKTTDMACMFSGCISLETLNIINFNTNRANVSSIFKDCCNLNTITIGENYVFSQTKNIPYGIWTNIATGETYDTNDAGSLYTYFERGTYTCNVIAQLYENGTLVIKKGPTLLHDNGDLIGQYYRYGSISSDNRSWYRDASQITKVVFYETIAPASTSFWFYNLSHLTEIEAIDYLDTSNVTEMFSMFSGCSNLATLDISGFDTSKVTDMRYMFNRCGLETLDLSSFDTSNVTTMNNMFTNCQNLTTLNINSFNTSNVTDMSEMFRNCQGVTNLNINGFDTGSVTNMMYMFSGCNNLTTLDLSNWNTSNVTTMHGMFSNCSRLTCLDINGFDTSNVTDMAYMFSSSNFYSIKIGQNFRFAGNNISSTNNMAIFPTPPVNSGSGESLSPKEDEDDNNNSSTSSSTEKMYTGKWIRSDGQYGPFTPTELRDSYDENALLYAGEWVWEEQPSYTVILDANGGYLENSEMSCYLDREISLPKPVFPGYYFLEWNTEQNGTGTSYLDGSAQSYTNITEPNETITLYAQWHKEVYYTYTIETYEESINTVGQYNLVSSVQNTVMDLWAENVLFECEYKSGFVTPESQTVTISSNNDTVIKFYYNRIRYNLTFDSNGNSAATYPSMDNLASTIGVVLPGAEILSEELQFAWNTRKDGSGRSYAPGSEFSYVPLEHGETITLYAIWTSVHEEASSQSGEVEITFRAGDTIKFPSLPAGTRYEIEEIDIPEGWTLEWSDGMTGVIYPNQNNNATIVNRYTSEVDVILTVYKSLVGWKLEPEMFSFDLLTEGKPGRYIVVDTQFNDEPDMNEETVESNPYYRMGAVSFTLHFDREGTYHYQIRENNNGGHYIYDEDVANVTITVTDVGNGTMDATVECDKVVFTNYMEPAMLPIIKTVSNESAAASNNTFNFKVELYEGSDSESGLVPLTGEYTVLYADGRTATISHNGTVTLKGGESCIIRGLPYMSQYKVTEIDASGYSLLSSANTEGVVELFDTVDTDGYLFDSRYAVQFENGYSSSGSAVLAATKVMVGAEIPADTYQFELKDDDGNVLQTVYAQEDGTIEFAPIYYGQSDNGNVYTYTISEVEGEDASIAYDTSIISVFVAVNDNGHGTMETGITYEKEPIFTNRVIVPLTVTNTVYGKYDGEIFHYTMTFLSNQLGAITYKLNDGEEVTEMIKNGTFSFTLGKGDKIEFVGIYGGTELEIVQDAMENFTTSVNGESSYTFHVDSLEEETIAKYVNANGITLPKTGSTASIVVMVCGGVVILGGLIFLIIKRKKKDDEEN